MHNFSFGVCIIQDQRNIMPGVHYFLFFFVYEQLHISVLLVSLHNI